VVYKQPLKQKEFLMNLKGLFIQNGYSKNGKIQATNLTLDQIKCLEKKKINLDLLVTSKIYLPFNFFNFLLKISKLKRLSNYDFLHFQYGSLLGFLGVFLNHRNKIISICGSDLIPNNKNLKSYIPVIFTKLSIPFYDKIIVKSPNLKNEIKAKYHHKVVIIPNGVDTDFFNERIIEKKCKKFKIAFNEGQNNKPIKNLPLALKTIKNLRANNLDILFQKFSNKTRNEVKEILQSADCLLVTSLHEGSPNIVKEALSVNTPVVSVDCGDVKERLKNVNKGGVSSKYDYKELSNLISEVYNSKAKFNGREILLSQGIDSETTASKLIELYKL